MADPVEQFLNSLQHPVMAGIDLKLERASRLLSLAGSPHKRLPPVIHVAGTNGKGSLLAYLQAVFEAAGYSAHRYTSPHLVEFRERIILRGKPIDNAYLQTILKHVASFLPSQPATFFEATTVMAFLAFAEKPADVLLLETGVGGRLDATNLVEKPILTAITPISFDHCEYLGDTIAKIAFEKAGILKKNVPCVVGRQQDEATQVIVKQAEKMAAPLSCFGQEWELRWQGDTAVYHSAKRTLPIAPSLAGLHQYDNAATAVACIDQLPQFSINDAQIVKGISNAVWPARLQRLKGRYAELLPKGAELWLDGGHNAQGGVVLAAWLKERGLETYIICGMVRRKDPLAFLAPLAPHTRALYSVTIPDEPESQPAEQVQMAAKSLGLDATSAASVENALQTISQRAKTPFIVCICGSLYLAGKVLATNG